MGKSGSDVMIPYMKKENVITRNETSIVSGPDEGRRSIKPYETVRPNATHKNQVSRGNGVSLLERHTTDCARPIKIPAKIPK